MRNGPSNHLRFKTVDYPRMLYSAFTRPVVVYMAKILAARELIPSIDPSICVEIAGEPHWHPKKKRKMKKTISLYCSCVVNKVPRSFAFTKFTIGKLLLHSPSASLVRKNTPLVKPSWSTPLSAASSISDPFRYYSSSSFLIKFRGNRNKLVLVYLDIGDIYYFSNFCTKGNLPLKLN